MGKLSKLIQQFLASPPKVRFEEVRTLPAGLGFHEAWSKGSHHIFRDDLLPSQ
jgi:predicted RNA binding protein YcfA (HicA-like mRNA interferase family)